MLRVVISTPPTLPSPRLLSKACLSRLLSLRALEVQMSALSPNSQAFPIADISPCFVRTAGKRRFQRHWTRTGFRIASSTRTSVTCRWQDTGMTCKQAGFPFCIIRTRGGSIRGVLIWKLHLGTCRPGRNLPCRYSKARNMPTILCIRPSWKPRKVPP